MHAETTFQTQTKMHANSQEDETQVLIHKKNNNLNCYLTLIDIKFERKLESSTLFKRTALPDQYWLLH